MMAELQEKELERRLSLFQVFLKLYEQHSSLLDDILQLENLTQASFAVNQSYVQGVIDGSTVYVITNLCDNKTQSLQQPQQIWTIGRDDSNGIYIADKYLSARHAAIQYIEQQGFYLFDFKSTNGSFVNGEPVYQPTKLNDGDRIRLGMITFDFFVNHTCRTLPTVALELLMQLVPGMDNHSINIFNSTNAQTEISN
ncbi:MAG: FHA domain-containing protein [Scytonema sp. CRU_2_7]|nr:FHA domain-containing protein [Scytonema sp. CRU_2_7]